MEQFAYLLLGPLDWLARAGGGGSSGGGGGGFSGGSYSSGAISSGGTSSPVSFAFMILGLFPFVFLGGFIAKLAKTTGRASAIGWPLAAVYGIVWFFIWPSMGFFILLGALLGAALGLYGNKGVQKARQSKLFNQALQNAAAKDSAWDEAKLTEFVTRTFMQYQADWSKRDPERMKAYMTPEYHRHASLLVAILTSIGRKDIMDDVKIYGVVIGQVSDSDDNTKDAFSASITASAHDRLVEDVSDEQLFADSSTFTEYWTFRRSGDGWLLDDIGQTTADSTTANDQLRELAETNGYEYSEDMGWLFIPKRGQLFGGAQFGTSDINNHIVGLYKDTLLVQLYSYVRNPNENNTPIVIAQVNVQRQYGDIVVRHKKTFQMGIRGLKRVETEWTKFNQKYEVFASDYEQATSFELLNPTYMEQLEALPFEVNIEVVDNVVYLYSAESGLSVETYQTMLDLLQKAFKEMRL
jgi:hypothetical protein